MKPMDDTVVVSQQFDVPQPCLRFFLVGSRSSGLNSSLMPM
jgi:hypothetical protein